MKSLKHHTSEEKNSFKRYIDKRMTIKHLKILAAIAEHGKLSVAADKLNTTTSNISKTLKEIEGFVETRLFDRRNGIFVETEHSRKLIHLASTIFAAMENAKRDMEHENERQRNITINMGYYRTLMSSRAHVLWNQLVIRDKSPNVVLNRLTPEDISGDELFDTMDVLVSSEHLGLHMAPGDWHVIERPIKELMFLVCDKNGTVPPRHFFLPACSESIQRVLSRHIEKHYPDHESISYYDSLHSSIKTLEHPGTCIVAERPDSQRMAQSVPLRVINYIKGHGLSYEVALNIESLKEKGMIDDIVYVLENLDL